MSAKTIDMNPLSEQVLRLTSNRTLRWSDLWRAWAAGLGAMIPASERKQAIADTLHPASGFDNSRVDVRTHEALSRLYVWLEGYEARCNEPAGVPVRA